MSPKFRKNFVAFSDRSVTDQHLPKHRSSQVAPNFTLTDVESARICK